VVIEDSEMTTIPVDENIDVLIPALSRALGGREGVLAFVKDLRPTMQPDQTSWANYLVDCLEDFVTENDEEFARLALETPLADNDEPLYKWDADLGDFRL
jgi:hypothetical protein